jgi:hypothetical protein
MLSELEQSIFQIRTERFILGVLGPLAFGDPISESQATDRSTFCPNARREVSSGLRCPPTEAVLPRKKRPPTEAAYFSDRSRL